MKINEIETSTNPSISTNIGSKNHWGVTFINNDTVALVSLLRRTMHKHVFTFRHVFVCQIAWGGSASSDRHRTPLRDKNQDFQGLNP